VKRRERRAPKYRNTTLTLIELDPARARHVADNLSHAIVLQGDVREPEILEEANLAAAGAMVAVTNNDEISIMAALLGKRYGCHRALTLVNNTAYSPLLGSLAIDVMISPREATVSSVLRHVRRGRIKSAYSLRDGEAEVLEAEALETSPLVGQALRDARLPAGVLVGAILRDGKMITPRADTVIRAHDRVIIVARATALKKVEMLFAVRVDYF
jgi:trk system potassium uptake protein TrkA